MAMLRQGWALPTASWRRRTSLLLAVHVMLPVFFWEHATVEAVLTQQKTTLRNGKRVDEEVSSFLAKDGAQARAAQSGLKSALTLPPDFWMWKTTPAPPTPPGPNPQLLWVAQTPPPLPTTGPAPEACYGCDCIYIDPTGTTAGGTFQDKYTCFGGGATTRVPEFKWAGAPVNSGQGHPLYAADGTSCLKSQSWAIHVEDIDYPYGVGNDGNKCFTLFWAVNIPGDWTSINEQLAFKTYKDLPLVTIGKNDGGTTGMMAPCPEYGVHRYRITLWAMRDYLGTELDPVDPNQPWSQILPVVEKHELAHSTFYANLKAKGYKPGRKTNFLQEASRWFQQHNPFQL